VTHVFNESAVDQTDFLTGKTDKSARESVVIYIGNVLFGVKWRNWKLLLKELDEDTYAIREMAYPSIYNLLVDPKEEVPELNRRSIKHSSWVPFLTRIRFGAGYCLQQAPKSLARRALVLDNLKYLPGDRHVHGVFFG